MVLRLASRLSEAERSRARAVELDAAKMLFFCDVIAECRGIGAFFSSFFSSVSDVRSEVSL